MRVVILTVGSRGDVQPYVALGAGLARAGHRVTVATGEGFEPLVERHGLAYRRLRADYLALAETPGGRAALAGDPLRLLRQWKAILRPMLRRQLDDGWAAARDAEVLLYHPKALGGYHIAEKLGVPAHLTAVVPAFTPTAAFPSPLLPPLRLSGALNRFSHTLVLRLAAAPYAGLVNAWRREALGLPPRPALAGEATRDGAAVPALYGVSPQVVPPPPDWPASAVETGYWFLDEAPTWTPPAPLEAFLAAGPAPVYVGFGSMAATDPDGVARIVLEALRRAGLRGVLAHGGGGLAAGARSETVFALDAAPHDWLFPRVAAVVHHGGAGTTAAGLRAGRPTLVCPFFGDQSYWGRRVHDLGVGPSPIPQRRLSARRLAAALRELVDRADRRDRAAALGARIGAEDGVAEAVKIVERTPFGPRPTTRPG